MAHFIARCAQGGCGLPNKFLAKQQNTGYAPFRKIRHASHGMWFAVTNDFSVAYKVVVSVVALLLCAVYAEFVDVIIILMATGLVLMAEIFNTAIEAICDYFETGYDEKIGAIKDLAAAAAGISIVVWLAVVLWELHGALTAAGLLG